MTRTGDYAADLWTDMWIRDGWTFAASIADSHKTNPWPDDPVLPKVMSHLMTQLWDMGFSQTEIREAFDEAVADMPRYAAGEERRS